MDGNRSFNPAAETDPYLWPSSRDYVSGRRHALSRIEMWSRALPKSHGLQRRDSVSSLGPVIRRKGDEVAGLKENKRVIVTVGDERCDADFKSRSFFPGQFIWA